MNSINENDQNIKINTDKSIYIASKFITKETMEAKRGKITNSQVLTQKYLIKLYSALSAGDNIKRYYGFFIQN